MNRTRFLRARATVVGLLAVSLCLSLTAGAANADNRFHEHRARAQQGQMQIAAVEGRVLGSQGDDRLLTSIAAPRLSAAGIGNMDNVRVRVAGHDMAARVMTADAFQQLSADPQALRDLDVDIICLIDSDPGQGGMEVVGLGGGLVPWIQPHGKMQITVEKVHF